MTTEGESILKIYKDLRNFFEQIVLLLQISDSLLQKKYLEIATNKDIAISGMGKSLNLAQIYYNYWLPPEFFRFYKFRNKKYPGILCFIAILLHDFKDEYYHELEQPLITAGWFNFGKEEIGKEGKKWDLWYSRFHAYMKGRKDDGTWIEADPKIVWPEDTKKEKYLFKLVRTFGLPLVEIRDSKILEDEVIKPLIEDIKNRATGNAG